MNKLKRNNKYSREDVFKIFQPSFTKDRKIDEIWKTWGPITLGRYIANMNNDFIFFVNPMSKDKYSIERDQGITKEGVLSWVSQNQNSFKSDVVKQYINHDEDMNTIYLFYREDKKDNYYYLGDLKYLTHDKNREKPVYFQFQIIDWDINSIKNLNFQKVDSVTKNINVNIKKHTLILKDAPKQKIKKGTTTKKFQGIKGKDYSSQDKTNKKLGFLGEILVLNYEIKYLKKNNRTDLANKVEHSSEKIGDGLGYDITSFDLKGNKKFIEVKTTRGGNHTRFYITPRELQKSKEEKKYYLYRVYNYKTKNDTGNLYIKKGALEDNFTLTPSEYKVIY